MKQILILILMMKQFQIFVEIELMLYGHLLIQVIKFGEN